MSSAHNGTAPRVIRIALADDEHLSREGLRYLLEREQDFRIVGHATGGSDVVRLVTRRKPRVLIVRAALLGPSELEITRAVHERAPATQVILISPLAAEWHLLAALRSGAAGYVSSLAERCNLSRAVRRVAAGSHYLSAPFSRYDIETWLRRSQADGSTRWTRSRRVSARCSGSWPKATATRGSPSACRSARARRRATAPT